MKKKIGWRDICPACVKYEHPDESPDCEHCNESGVTESILCDLNRRDQENDSADFQCGAFEAKQPSRK